MRQTAKKSLGFQYHSFASIVKTQEKIADFFDKSELQEKVSKLEGVDFLGKQELASVASMISLTDKQFMDVLGLQKKLKTIERTLTAATGATRQKQHARKS